MAIDRHQAPDFSLRQLQYAVAVDETGRFGVAAELCGVSQPSLSSQIGKLEDTLGAKLFERAAGGVIRTAAGERLLPTFRATLAAAARVETTAATLDDPYALPVRVAVIPTVAPYLLPAVVRTLSHRDRAPVVHWLELKTQRAEEAVQTGAADAMVIADPPSRSGLHERQLGWEPFVAAVPRGEPVPSRVSLDWLGTRDVLLLEDGHCLRDHALSLCRIPATRESPFRATSLPTLVQMVASGLGVSVLPAMAIDAECGRANIEVRPFSVSSVGRTLWMAWRLGHPSDAVLTELADCVQEVTREALHGALPQPDPGPRPS